MHRKSFGALFLQSETPARSTPGSEPPKLLPSEDQYKLECIRQCLQYDKQLFGLQLLNEVEKRLQPHIPEETLGSQEQALAAAVMFLVLNKRNVVNSAANSRMKALFGTCPFKELQEIHELALSLKLEIPATCLQYIVTKKHERISGRTLWDSLEMATAPLIDCMPPNPPQHLYLSIMPLAERKPIFSFSMAYPASTSAGASMSASTTNTTKSSNAITSKSPRSLEDFYIKYGHNLSHLSCAEFIDSMRGILSSSKPNDELQNDLFEMLGFEAFELISELLDNRIQMLVQQPVISASAAATVATISGAIPKQTTVNGVVAPHPARRKGKQDRKPAPALSSQVVIQSEDEKAIAKQLRKMEKKERKLMGKEEFKSQNAYGDENNEYYDEPEEFPDYNYQSFAMAKASINTMNTNPNIHDEQREVQVKAMLCGQLANIPHDAEKLSTKTYDSITIPAKKATQPINTFEKIKVSTMDKIGKMVFRDIEDFNTIQSEVYPVAYHSNENMLICAPTGAGKTNIALLTIVQTIKSFFENDVLRLEKFKIVYVCPMKALANEMASNFSRKLKPLGVTVRELTGDMQLTRKEINETQMLITTPEKWDVISRKGTTDGELTGLLKLLILDEVHLLNTDRGPVIEALVARTLRQVVHSQNMIRIIGISATLPNYMDIAHFLRVNTDVGLFYFDSRYRSVPLTQTFIGVKSAKQNQQLADIDEVCFDKVVEFLRDGHQVMVFVHARNQTTKTANYLKEEAAKRNLLHLLEPDNTLKSKQSMANHSNKNLMNLVPFGLGVHHAGMLRKDRNEVEKCFLDGAIKVLVCTATLAWGVNLPAHGVVIKGTKLYDSKRGTYIDLDILDVMQIFGRAGRPQFDSSGHGIIITTHDKLHYYLSAMTNQIPIESKLLDALTDNLNAEIILGSVSNVQEAVEWMTFTYLYRRMKMNPQVYSLQYSDLETDPNLREALFNFVTKAAKLLDKARMIRYEPKTGDLTSTNLGRTASYYYINFDTIEVFNDLIKPSLNEGEIINMMCLAKEFQQIQLRQEELEDLDELLDTYCEYSVQGGVENVHGKVNILMQTFLSRGFIKSVSLGSDREYITQSAARIARALFDIAVHQNRALLAGRCLLVAQMFEQRLWPHQTPLRQFAYMDLHVLNSIEERKLNIVDLRERSEREIADALRNMRAAGKVKQCADAFPSVEIEATLQPITRAVIRVKFAITPNFKWNMTYHGKNTVMFWIWIEDPDNDMIYHTETFNVTKMACMNQEPIELIFTIPLVEPRPTQYIARVSSDRWMHAVYTHSLSFLDLQLPTSFTPHTDLLDLQPLEKTALKNPLYEELYSFTHFNAVQTQIFHCLYHTDYNVLLGAPTGSGKTIAAEICMFRLFNNTPSLKVVYIAPLKALVRERVEDWKKKFAQGALRKRIVEMTGDVTPSPQEIMAASIIITTPEKWDGMSRGWQTRHFIREIGLMVIDEIHLLGEDRGPVLEVIVSRTNFIADRTGRKMRIIGLSTAMANARDLGDWLGIGEMGLYNFRPNVRPVPLEVHISGFPGKHYCPRMMSMNRPAYQAIRQHAHDSPALVFCSSRKQTRLTAIDLTTYLVTDADPKQWLHCDEANMEVIVSNINDPDLKQFLSFGIGIHHAGLHEKDRQTVEELFVNQKIQVLIATGTLAWGVNFPAHLVVIKGTEYFDGKIKRYVDMPITDVLQMMGRAGRPQFDTSGVACVFVHDIKKNFYRRFLYEPFPVESQLLSVLPDHVNAEIAAETVPTKTQLMHYMTWTYLFRRLLTNPQHYKLQDVEPATVNQYLSGLIDSVINELVNSNCVNTIQDENNVHYESTFFGRVASYYYLSHKTMCLFQKSLRPDLSIEEIMSVMASVEEYATFPVRHNEDKINMELAKHLRLKAQGSDFESPHLKVQILLRMYISNLVFPNQEYILDLKSVMDQSLRILQAMVDVTANAGWLASTLRVIHLMQMLIQGRWLHEESLLTVVNAKVLPDLTKQLQSNRELAARHATILPGLILASHECQSELENACGVLLNAKQLNTLIKNLHRLPSINLSMKMRDTDTETVQTVATGESSSSVISIRTKVEYELQCTFVRRGAPSSSKGNGAQVLSDRYPKRKDEGWFLCVGKGDELCAIKRLTMAGRRTNTTLRLPPAEYLGTFEYSVMLMSDSYIGLDQQHTILVQAISQ